MGSFNYLCINTFNLVTIMQPILIAGPCVIESAELLDTVAQKIVSINNHLHTKS